MEFNYEKEGNPVICGNTDGTGGNNVKWNVRHRKTNTTCSHWFIEAKNVDLIDIESTIVVTEGRKWERERERVDYRYQNTITEEELVSALYGTVG
jgi:hypothetical protein